MSKVGFLSLVLSLLAFQFLFSGEKPELDPFAIPNFEWVEEQLKEDSEEASEGTLSEKMDAAEEVEYVEVEKVVKEPSSDKKKIDMEKSQEPNSKWIRRYYLHLNGYSIHFDKQPDPGETVNDYLLGLGGGIEFNTDGTLIWDISLDVFNDSNEEISVTLGPTVQYPLADWLGIGAAGFLMYKEAFQRDYGFPILPVPLPFLEGKTKYVHLRMFYIPPVRRSTDQQLVFQLRIPF